MRQRHVPRASFIEPLEARTLLSSKFVPPPAGAPGTIEAENYNLGGQNVGYHSSLSSNPGKLYRNDGVGIGAASDAGGGYFVGWTTPGEWLNYTVNIASATTYTLDLRVASANGGTAHLSCNGVTVSPEIKLPNTGSWQTWTTVSVPNIALPAGTHLLRLTIDSATNSKIGGVVNINWLRLRDNAYTSPRTAWWRNAKYGLFIHWGLYSQLAGHYNGQTYSGYGELIEHGLNIPLASYQAIARQFDPSQFNAQAWVNMAKAAGFKYIVITAKHVDGFSMFNSATSSFNVVNDTPWHEDPLAQLSAACKAAGIGFGVYYAIMDWNHPELSDNNTGPGATSPSAPAVANFIHNQLEPQLKELITQYHPQILWMDGEWMPWWTEEWGREVQEYVQALSPGIILNNRIGKRTSTDGDYDTPEQVIPTSEPANRLWETCMTLNNTWGYKDTDTAWKSSTTVISDLVDSVATGGNYLLNVGPTGAGVFPSAAVSILNQVGSWLKTNGSAIYNTTTAPIEKESWGYLTRDGNTLYAIVFHWPTTGTLHIPIGGTATSAKLLATGSSVAFTSTGNGLNLTLPTKQPQSPATVIQIGFKSGMWKGS